MKERNSISENFSVVVGLGNPGQRYLNTRHNIGFIVVSNLWAQFGRDKWRRKGEVEVSIGKVQEKELFFIKPQLYMNRSGFALKPFFKQHDILLEKFIVIHDDVDLEFGRLRIRRNGGSGGHKGISSMIEALGSSNFTRIRVGIGRPAYEKDVSDYVLESFSKVELKLLPQIIETISNSAVSIILEGLTNAMNKFNGLTEF